MPIELQIAIMVIFALASLAVGVAIARNIDRR